MEQMSNFLMLTQNQLQCKLRQNYKALHSYAYEVILTSAKISFVEGLAKGGQRNKFTEDCLCLKSLADTYKPRRHRFARGVLRGDSSSALWSRVANHGSLKLPSSEPMPRRKSLTHFPSYHNEISTPSRPPPPPEEVIYDDVHQSTVYLNRIESASQQVSFAIEQRNSLLRLCQTNQLVCTLMEL